jgi:hypothetical protein
LISYSWLASDDESEIEIIAFPLCNMNNCFVKFVNHNQNLNDFQNIFDFTSQWSICKV